MGGSRICSLFLLSDDIGTHSARRYSASNRDPAYDAAKYSPNAEAPAEFNPLSIRGMILSCRRLRIDDAPLSAAAGGGARETD